MIKIKKGYANEVIDVMEEIHENYEEEFPLYRYHDYSELIKMLNEGKIDMLFLSIDKRNRLICFIQIFEYIDDDYKYEFFEDVYSDVEGGFYKIPTMILNKVKELQSSNIKKLLELKADNEYLTVYRGQSVEHQNIKTSLSWSLDIKVAKFFAKRFGKGNIYTGKVHINDVICYITGREEEEIIVKFENVKDINLDVTTQAF